MPFLIYDKIMPKHPCHFAILAEPKVLSTLQDLASGSVKSLEVLLAANGQNSVAELFKK
jgi:hypothetical protein